MKPQHKVISIFYGFRVWAALALCFISLAAWSADSSAPSVKWHPGIYIKLEDKQLMSAKEMEVVYNELKTTPAIRGIKVVMKWGRYETRDAATGTSIYNFQQIDDILNRLAALDNKHLILTFAWRAFQVKNDADAAQILPSDLRGSRASSLKSNNAPLQYDYLWAYKDSKFSGMHGYNMKLWNPQLQARIDAFLAALAARFDQHPNLDHIATTESAIGEPIVPFASGEGAAQQYAGQLAVLRMMKKHFVHSMVVPDLNFSPEHVAHMVRLLEKEGFGLGTSNSHRGKSINRSTPANAPGVLTYFPKLSGKVMLAPEIQGLDLRTSSGEDRAKDYPSYESLYLRVRDVHKANYTVIQRNYKFWFGGTTDDGRKVPSMLEFLRTYEPIVNDRSGAGGLNHVKPTSVR